MKDSKETYVVKRIEEQDYGCEGIQEGSEPMVSVFLENADGTLKIIHYSDKALYENDIDEGDCVTIVEHKLLKVNE